MMAGFWQYNSRPNEAGWYAVLVCYDEAEGMFPQAAHWDGNNWGRKAVVSFGESRATEQGAKALAYEYDPGA